jgi:sugar/nucleoside kinase (ribokinase family)
VNPTDTTGAGDSFNAGVVLARLVGLSWEAAALLGNAVGAISTNHHGSGAALVNRAVVAKLVESHLFREGWEAKQVALEELTGYFEGVL